MGRNYFAEPITVQSDVVAASPAIITIDYNNNDMQDLTLTGITSLQVSGIAYTGDYRTIRATGGAIVLDQVGYVFEGNIDASGQLANYDGTVSNTVQVQCLDASTNTYAIVCVPNKEITDYDTNYRVGDSTATPSADTEGMLRYSKTANSSALEMVMQTGSSTYAWVEVKSNTW